MPFDEACLLFHKTKRPVRTTSIVQGRATDEQGFATSLKTLQKTNYSRLMRHGSRVSQLNRAQKRQQQKLASKTARQKNGAAKVSSCLPDEFLNAIVEKGAQAHRAGRIGEAESFYRQVLDNKPNHGDANHLMGMIAHQVSRNDRAIQFFKKAIHANPDKAAYHASLSSALLYLGRFDDAVSSCRKAITLDPNYTKAHANLAVALQRQGKLDEAIASYRRAIAIDPNIAETHNNLGNALKENGLLDEALSCYRHSLTINPGGVEAHYNVGFALQEQGQFEAAMESYRQALKINPAFAPANFNLSNLYEKTFQLEKADYHIRQALNSNPSHPGANVSLAILMRRRGEPGAAIKLLEGLNEKKFDDGDACRVHFELGKLYDIELDSAQAFRHFALANAAQARLVGYKVGLRAAEYRQFIKSTDHALSPEFVESWVPVKPATAAETPVFLVGFPRSGTTLLDQILDGHKQIQVMEEISAMATVRASVEAMPGGYPGALARLKESDIKKLRALYISNVEQVLERQPGAILIDKLPLNIVNIPLIVRLFPDARFILALRHPLDVIMSNFMQFFQLNDATSNFVTIEDATTLYCLVMNMWLHSVMVLTLNFHAIKYENLVADIEGEARALLEFLGLDWDEKVLDYRTHARQRGVINTPSYTQVTEAIYQHAKYRWIRYKPQLSPVIDRVQPLAEAFGYSI